jgi:hypothetical protein
MVLYFSFTNHPIMKHALLTGSMFLPMLAIGQANNYPNGSTVNDFTITDTHGVVHNLNAYAAAGKYVILDFFFYNCGPCQANAHYYSQLYETYGCNSHDLICIEINNGSDTDVLTEQFSADFGGGYADPPAVGSGGGEALTTTFGVSAFPTYCLIGPDKVMINHDIWPLSSGMNTFVDAFPAGSNIDEAPCLVGVHETPAAAAFLISPSLTSGLLNITVDHLQASSMMLEILDPLGRRVLADDMGDAQASQRTLDIGHLRDGEYLVRLIADGRIVGIQRITLAR